MKYDVFISYSRKDFDEVSALIDAIRAEVPDLSIWFDITGIESGDEFEEKIISAIDNSSYVLFALSENSIGSKWTKDEVMYARNTDKKVIPVLLKGAQMKGWFLFKFGRVHCTDSTNDLQMEKLLQNLSDWTGKNRTSETAAESVVQSKPESLCPCGSGRFFKDCHGSDKLRVGDYYNVDGKEGVVFWLDSTGNHGKIVSMDDTQLPWCTVAEDGLLTGSSDYEDGMKNLNVIMKIDDWREKYPAFAWCADHGDGWYLPAINELKVLLLDPIVRSRVNNALFKKMVSTIPPVGSRDWYWSSTEFERWSSWDINMRDGKATASLRISMCKVLAVTAF